MMELSKENQAQIEEDRSTTHAVTVLCLPLSGSTVVNDEGRAEASIADAIDDIDQRAKAANLQAFAPQISQSTCANNGVIWLTVTIIVQWVDREKLQSLQRQQALMGGPGRG
jgi:hypothetical protein